MKLAQTKTARGNNFVQFFLRSLVGVQFPQGFVQAVQHLVLHGGLVRSSRLGIFRYARQSCTLPTGSWCGCACPVSLLFG